MMIFVLFLISSLAKGLNPWILKARFYKSKQNLLRQDIEYHHCSGRNLQKITETPFILKNKVHYSQE